MKSNQYDLAVFGSSPQALFLAALLAEDQSQRVALVHNPANRVRLMRALHLSVAPLTRPQTWSLLADGVEETRRRLGAAGLGATVEHCDVIMTRMGPAGRAALGHVRGVAGTHGIAVEQFLMPANPAWDAAGLPSHALLFRDAWRFAAGRAEPGLMDWLDRLGVTRVSTGAIEQVQFTRDGAVNMTANGIRIGGDSAVLADDEAIQDHANEADYKSVLAPVLRTGLLTTPIEARLPGRVPVMLAEGLGVLQRASGALAAIGDGPGGPVAERLVRFLPDFGAARLAGRARFLALAPLDGAPAAGRGRTRRCWIVGGMGETGVFALPGLARFIAGKSAAGENAYWQARGLARDGGLRVDDLGAAAAGPVAGAA